MFQTCWKPICKLVCYVKSALMFRDVSHDRLDSGYMSALSEY